MRVKYCILTVSLSCAIGISVAASPARDYHERNNAFQTGDTSHHIRKLFREIHLDADDALNQTGTLKTLTVEPSAAQFGTADELNRLQVDINDMGVKLCRLEAVRNEATPAQKEAIDGIARNAQLMVDNASDAIQFARAHHGDEWNSEYRNYLNNLYGEADGVTKLTERAVHLG